MLLRMLCAFNLILSVTSCRQSPEPPSQQAVEEAWRRAEQAGQQTISAHDEVKHIARLREIDRLRHEADVTELQMHTSALHGLVIALAWALVACLVWLAVEIRRRRMLSAVIEGLQQTDRGRPSTQRPIDEDSPTSVVPAE